MKKIVSWTKWLGDHELKIFVGLFIFALVVLVLIQVTKV